MPYKAKDIIYADESREKIKSGVNKLAKAVVTTLGPRGRNVAYEQEWGIPQVLQDGVSVAKQIFLEDRFENIGAQLVKDAASKTADKAGDGTTTATLLTQEIYNEGARQITAGANPMIMARGMQRAVDLVLEELKKVSKSVPIKDTERVKQVASVSAKDPQLGEKIGEAIIKVGKSGVVAVEEGGNKKELVVETTEGMEFDRGWYSRHFVLNQTKGETELTSPYIVVSDKRLTTIHDVMKFLEEVLKSNNKNIVIICDDISGDALATFALNFVNGRFFALPVRCPEFGERRKEVLEDICALTGATLISDSMGRSWQSLTLQDCGRAEVIWSSKDRTRIINGRGNKEKIQERIDAIEEQLKDKDIDESQKDFLKARLAKLTSGVAIIRVGATTEAELRDRKERVDDAIHATQAAIEEGVVVGGGVALLRARKAIQALFEKVPTSKRETEEITGARIIYEALEKPLWMIAENSGEKGDVVVNKVESNTEPDYGFDSVELDYGNLQKKGIIDPTKVVRLALENAVSVAITALTTEALITNREEKQPANPQLNVPFGGGA